MPFTNFGTHPISGTNVARKLKFCMMVDVDCMAKFPSKGPPLRSMLSRAKFWDPPVQSPKQIGIATVKTFTIYRITLTASSSSSFYFIHVIIQSEQ